MYICINKINSYNWHDIYVVNIMHVVYEEPTLAQNCLVSTS